MKYFIITIDTEGDNIWSYKAERNNLLLPETKNADSLMRFQQLCEKYHFFPTYLVDYEMARSPVFIDFGRDIVKREMGEIGMHMHAFSTPPFYELADLKGRGLAFAGEYPQDILYQKMEYMTKILQDTFQVEITSHRGGRWYLDKGILNILDKLGYKVDCTVTPGINWRLTKGQTGVSEGSDYSRYKPILYRIRGTHLKELPMTILNRIRFSVKKEKIFQSQKIWMRPNGSNLSDLLWLIKRIESSNVDYIEFMLHSSELMEAGSPTFRSRKDIETLYSHMEILFTHLTELGYKGISCSN